VNLLPVYRDDGERVGKPEDIALDERVGGDDCVVEGEVRE
jgi:sporulation protein YlmC with PRC-barrel domain